MADAMKADDAFTCGRCGATSTWGQRYYQDITPNTPFPPAIPSWGWDKVEHYRAFCPTCGALVADRRPGGMEWVDGAKAVTPGKSPGEGGEGGDWILPIQDFRSNLVPFGEHTLDIGRFTQAKEAVRAKEQGIRTMSTEDLVRRLRESKGTRAGDVESELASRGEQAVPLLVEALRDSEVYLRWRTCYVLKQMGAQAAGAREALEAARKDEAESVRSGAEDALRTIGHSTSSQTVNELRRKELASIHLDAEKKPWWRFW